MVITNNVKSERLYKRIILDRNSDIIFRAHPVIFEIWRVINLVEIRFQKIKVAHDVDRNNAVRNN